MLNNEYKNVDVKSILRLDGSIVFPVVESRI